MWNNYELEILYKDESLVAINKPSGLLVHKSMIDKHEIYFANKMLRDQIAQWVYPVHRLDKPTSGVLLFALNKDTARVMSKQFKEHTIEKNLFGCCPRLSRGEWHNRVCFKRETRQDCRQRFK